MSRRAPPEDVAFLSAEELTRFCDYLYRRTGMTFGESKRYYIDRRVEERMRATKTPEFRQYFAKLRSDDRELERVINAFTVNETYFYREAHQLACLSQNLLPELVKGKTPGDKVRIWCNPCSTGEEAYSIAIWLLENWPLVDAYNIEILGSDIDTQVLEQARQGYYEQRALSRLPAELIEAYFEPGPDTAQRIIADLRESVTWTQVNLIDRSSMVQAGEFEIIFCRNVLIYFDEASRRSAAEHLFERLHPGGFLLLGHTESMGRIDDRFVTRRFSDAIVYQRPAGS